ncbi:MAG: CHAP domain-containing protein [Nocardioidaceae bacterium]
MFARRIVAALTCMLLACGLSVGLAAAPAEAAYNYLCKGYAACAQAGMSSAGYAAANGTMYWRMYAGHNCTNYAAYRMVQNGMPNVRPWTGDGNATNWGVANAGLTDGVPAVGAVAWWRAGAPPAGSAGHVGYVERVVSPDEIIVSQDMWGGDFSWARITRTGGYWPSGFIHFKDVPLTNTSKPTVTGTAKVGAQLAASPGTWSQPDATISYQWRADGVNIANATSPTFKLRLAQQGKKISVRTTAAKLGYPTATVSSPSTPAVEPGEISNTVAPAITGVPQVDQTLTASAGEWTPAATAETYQWFADGAPIDGATAPTLPVTPDLVQKAVTVTVTASKAGYTDVPVTSAATTPVLPGTFTVSAPPTVSGTPQPGQTLTFDPGTFTPEGTVAVQWLRGGAPIEGATGTTYQPTAADLGAHLAARMTLTRDGYTTVTSRTAPTRVIRSVPTLTVLPRPGTGRMRVTVRVTAPGVPSVDGAVRIRMGGRLLAELTLRDGTATTTLTGLKAGTRTVKVRYVGSATVTAAALTRTVQIG